MLSCDSPFFRISNNILVDEDQVQLFFRILRESKEFFEAQLMPCHATSMLMKFLFEKKSYDIGVQSE